MRPVTVLLSGLALSQAFMPPPSAPMSRSQLSMSSLGLSSSKVDPMYQGSSPFFQDVLRRRKYTSMTDHGGIIINNGGGDGEGGSGGGGGGGRGGGEGNKGGDNPLVLFWKGYNEMLNTQPLLTKALTSLVGFSLGDFLAQKFIDKKDELDVNRLLRMASFGFLIHGPTGHLFYGALDGKFPKTDAGTVALKVGIDQFFWNPIFGVMFLGYQGLAQGQSLDQVKAKIDSDLIKAVKGSWTVWIPAHFINFSFIPNSQRLLYINTIQIGYNCFLSILGNQGNAAPAGKK